MTYDEWFDTYKPIENTITPVAAFDGCMFETFGDDSRFVKQENEKDPFKVWTLLDSDGEMWIGSGWSYVNRVGYFVTEVAFEPTDTRSYLQVPVDDNTEYEGDDDDGNALSSAGRGTDEDYGSAADVL